MIDPFSAWRRMVEAGFEMQRTWLRGVETVQASGSVIAARTDILRAAAANPAQADLVEIGRMVPEKVDAFGRSVGVVIRDIMAMQTAWIMQMQRVGMMVFAGRMPSLVEASRLGQRTAHYAFGAMTASARLGTGAIAPIHRTAAGNARRLRRPRPKAPRR